MPQNSDAGQVICLIVRDSDSRQCSLTETSLHLSFFVVSGIWGLGGMQVHRVTGRAVIGHGETQWRWRMLTGESWLLLLRRSVVAMCASSWLREGFVGGAFRASLPDGTPFSSCILHSCHCIEQAFL